MNRPTLRQLEYLVAIAEHGNFHRAAEACLVSQPALSAQVRVAERAIGATLFERFGRRVFLTETGRAVVEQARAVLAAVDGMIDDARGRAEPLRGPLSLGVIPTLAPYLLPRVLPTTRRRWPELELALREERTARLLELLRSARLDLLLLALPIEDHGLATRALFDDPFVLAVPRDHALAGRKRARLGDLESETVLLLDDGHCLRDQALSVCSLAGAREPSLRATSLSTLVQMVANGLGVTLLPQMALRAEVGREIVAIPFAKPAPARTIGLAWRASSPRAAEFELLAEIFQARGAGRE